MEDMNKDIKTAFDNSKSTSEENENIIIEQGHYSHFTPSILSAINDVERRKSVLTPLLSNEYIMKTEALNVNKALIDNVIFKLTLEGKIINKKTPQCLDSFYNSTKEIDKIQYGHSQNQRQSTNFPDINSSFLSEAAPSVDKNLQTRIHESSITKKVPNFEIPSDNPTFKENTPRIYTNINTSKLKPDSNDTLHTFQKLTSLRLNLILSKVLLLGKYLI